MFKTLFGGLIFGRLIFGGADNRREFFASKWAGHDNTKSSFKHKDNGLKKIKVATLTFYEGGPIIGRTFASEIWEAYFREGLFRGGGGKGVRIFTM